MRLRLLDGNRVCVVGGGPAGSFAALHLLRLAREQGLRLEVLIFEPRDFNLPGPRGCNRCAGILSSRLLHGLDELGLPLPREVIQSELSAYAIHLDGDVLGIKKPEPGRRIVSVYRGGGPRLQMGEPPASFDGFLHCQAGLYGAQLVRARVRKVTWEGRPVVYAAGQSFPVDLLVLASGVNSRSPLVPSFNYSPPQTAVMAQDELLRPPSWPVDHVSVFFRYPPGLTFGALIPKGRYLNISLLGRGLSTEAVNEFLEAQGLEDMLTFPSGSLCGCTPRIAISPAKTYFGDRWVAVGDAAVTRLYKDGIGSALYTARAAMEVAVQKGISRQAFQKGYAPVFRKIAKDNWYGRRLFNLWEIAQHHPRILRAWKNAIQAEARYPFIQRVHTRILWGMFTGDELYRQLFWLFLSPASLHGLARGFQGEGTVLAT